MVIFNSGFKDPEVALTCSSEPTNNIVSVTWSPVHEDHDSVADILKSVKFQYCKVEIHCENEYDKVHIIICKWVCKKKAHEYSYIFFMVHNF